MRCNMGRPETSHLQKRKQTSRTHQTKQQKDSETYPKSVSEVIQRRLAPQALKNAFLTIPSSKKGPPNRPKSVPKRSKSDPRGPQERSKRPPRTLQEAKRLQEEKDAADEEILKLSKKKKLN